MNQKGESELASTLAPVSSKSSRAPPSCHVSCEGHRLASERARALDAAPTLLAAGQPAPDPVRGSGGDVFWIAGDDVGTITKLSGSGQSASTVSTTHPDNPTLFDVEGDLLCYSEFVLKELACGPTSLAGFSPVPGFFGYARRVAFHDEHLYWTTWEKQNFAAANPGAVYRVPTSKLADGTVTAADIEKLVDLPQPFDLAFDAENVYVAAWASSSSGGGIYAVSKEAF